MKNKARYEQNISKASIIVPCLAFTLFIAITLISITSFLAYFLVIPIFVLLAIILLESISYYQFSSNGQRYQNKLFKLITDRIRDCQTIIDIGCGSGYLTIEIAKCNKTTNVMGIDNWEKRLGYTKKQCIINSKEEGVRNTDYFDYSTKGIELENGTVDCVVSCLAFHKMRSPEQRELIINESLRILKTGGIFIFIDLFASNQYFPSEKTIQPFLEKHDCEIDENKAVSELINLPFPLRSALMLRNARLIRGIKRER